MDRMYHEGERAVQARAGVLDEAARVGRMIRSDLPAVAGEFLRQQPMAVLTTVDGAGAVWVSLLEGPAGFLQPQGARELRIAAEPLPLDPWAENLRGGGPAGLLAIEPATRRRMRVNGTAELLPSGGLVLRPRQVYSNCPKYIQARAVRGAEAGPATPGPVREGRELEGAQRALIQRADTLFLGSLHLQGGADASHRGGAPGFVRVLDAGRLMFPDYSGNHMFQTLGNLESNPRAGLLFVDFETGDVLQLTGRARVEWDPARREGIAGAERLVELEVDRWIQHEGASRLRWTSPQPSPFNPS